jgi:molecular chaperone HscB
MSSPGEGLPSLTADYFQFLGIERKLQVDVDDLQKRFYALSRRLHPDRFTRKSAEEQQYSLDATSLLNDAYRVLRDPMQRAEYILKQEGYDIGEQRSKDVPPELLEEVFELNMALEEMREGDDSARPQLEQARARFHGMRDDIDTDIQGLFAKYDATSDRDVLAAIRASLNRRRYIRNLVSEVEKALSPAEPVGSHQ